MLKSTRNPLFLNPFIVPDLKSLQKNFEFMVSLSPVAPFFGIPWVFAPNANFFRPETFLKPVSSKDTQAKKAVSTESNVAPAKPKTTPKKTAVKAASQAKKKAPANKPPANKPLVVRNRFESDGLVSSRTSANKSAKQASGKQASQVKAATPAPKVVQSSSVPEASKAQTDNSGTPTFDFEKTRSTISSGLNPVVNPATDTKAETTSSASPIARKPTNLLLSQPQKQDDLKLINGIGPKLEVLLNKLGIYNFEQFTGYTPRELQWIDDNLSAFKGRALRDDWVEQASQLLKTAPVLETTDN